MEDLDIKDMLKIVGNDYGYTFGVGTIVERWVGSGAFCSLKFLSIKVY